MNDIILSTQNGEPVVSSRQIAESFGKEHKHVLDAVKNLVAENSAAKSMFHPATFENRGKQYPMYLMNRDGFSLLAFGFTGKEAFEWKLKYIQAFNAMEKQLMNQKQAVLDGLSPQLRYLINLEQQQNQQAKQLAQVNERWDAACEALSLNVGVDWEKRCQSVIKGIAFKRGGSSQDYEDVWNEIYDAMDARGFDMKRRTANAQARSASYGIAPTSVKKITRLKVISQSCDKKLIYAFVDAVREKAAAASVRVNKLDEIRQTSLFDSNATMDKSKI